MPAGKGILAGFVATVVLSVCMFAQAMAHWAPALNAVVLLQRLIGGGVIGAWIGYFVIGTLIWGLVFVWLYSRLPGGYGVFRGLVFGVLAWAAMLLLFFRWPGPAFWGQHSAGTRWPRRCCCI